jgi:hypothetical protein
LRKAIYIGAALLLAFASANAVSRKASTIHVVYQPAENGDFRLFLFGSDRTLVCEEKEIKIVNQGDAVNPVVLECSHGKAMVSEPRMAAGEWKIEAQTPPCDSVHNLQVIYPKESGAPITIECDAMPVPSR